MSFGATNMNKNAKLMDGWIDGWIDSIYLSE